MMACQHISRRPWDGEATDKQPKNKSTQPRGQTDLQTPCANAPELAIVLAAKKCKTHSGLISKTSTPRPWKVSSLESLIYLFRGRWCVIGPCVGVKQAGTALCNPGSINPSALIHLSRIPERTSRYPYMLTATTKTQTIRSKNDAERKKFSTSLGEFVQRLIPSQSFWVHATQLPPAQRFPLASSLLADLHRKVPRVLRWSAPDHLAVLLRTGVRRNSAWGKTTILAGRKVVLYSLPFERLSFCSSAPSPHISEVPPIGWPLVVGFYVAMGGSSGWEEDGFKEYKVSGMNVLERRYNGESSLYLAIWWTGLETFWSSQSLQKSMW